MSLTTWDGISTYTSPCPIYKHFAVCYCSRWLHYCNQLLPTPYGIGHISTRLLTIPSHKYDSTCINFPQKQDGQLNKTTIRWDDWMLAELESYKIFKGHKKGAITWNIMWVSDSCCGGTSPPLHGVLKGILSLPLIRR